MENRWRKEGEEEKKREMKRKRRGRRKENPTSNFWTCPCRGAAAATRGQKSSVMISLFICSAQTGLEEIVDGVGVVARDCSGEVHSYEIRFVRQAQCLTKLRNENFF